MGTAKTIQENPSVPLLNTITGTDENAVGLQELHVLQNNMIDQSNIYQAVPDQQQQEASMKTFQLDKVFINGEQIRTSQNLIKCTGMITKQRF